MVVVVVLVVQRMYCFSGPRRRGVTFNARGMPRIRVSDYISFRSKNSSFESLIFYVNAPRERSNRWRSLFRRFWERSFACMRVYVCVCYESLARRSVTRINVRISI